MARPIEDTIEHYVNGGCHKRSNSYTEMTKSDKPLLKQLYRSNSVDVTISNTVTVISPTNVQCFHTSPECKIEGKVNHNVYNSARDPEKKDSRSGDTAELSFCHTFPPEKNQPKYASSSYECKFEGKERSSGCQKRVTHRKEKCHLRTYETSRNYYNKRTSHNTPILLMFLICLFILLARSHQIGICLTDVKYIPVPLKRKKIKYKATNPQHHSDIDLMIKKLRTKLHPLNSLLVISDKTINYLRNIIVFPVDSLRSYFSGIENGTSFEDSMNYEWARLRSFSSFRSGFNVSPVVLSRSGCFYTGRESEVKCYSCGTTFRELRENDNVYELHRRMSPNCQHLAGNDRRNVPVAHRNETSSNHQQGEADVNFQPPCQHPTTPLTEQHSNNRQHITDTSNSTGIAHGHNFVQQNRTPHVETTSRNGNGTRYSHDAEQHSATNQRSGNSNTNREANHTSPPINSSGNNVRTSHQNNTSGVSSAAINKLSPLGVNFDKPRYPQYAILTVRISTYNGWPGTQSRRKMAEAGFIYAGYADYTRCFFCGGGLRNWEEGDDPWIEHARWFPRCAYVRQNKGDQFVQLVHGRLEDMVRSAAEENMAATPRYEGIEMAKVPAPQETVNTQSVNMKDGNKPEELKSLPSYQSVLELGYTSELVENVIRQLQRHGKKEFTSTDILEVIFKMEDGDNVFQMETIGNQVTVNNEQSQVEEALSLMEENRRLRQERLCMICVDQESCITFLPCGHLVCCEDCAPAARKCPRCQQIVQGSIKTWLA